MIDIPNISQTTAMGSNNTQIGFQYNHEEHHHSGLSVTDATVMALEIFRQYFPQLQKEAQESLRIMLDEELTKRAPQQINPPSARIALPTLQGASVSDEEDVRRLYASLLASSMDNTTCRQAHPAFARIIDQMNSFDARLLKRIAEINDNIPVATIKITNGQQYYPAAMPRFYGMVFDDFGDNWGVSFSIENLARLQIINIHDGSIKSFDYNQFKTCSFAVERHKIFQDYHKDKELKVEVSEHAIEITDFGKQFIALCI